MNSQYKDFSGYILAGGKSSRMGRDKALLQLDDRSFAENAVYILTSLCGNRIKIVLNSDQSDLNEKLPAGFAHIFDVYRERGPLGGIHAALSDCKTKYAVILAVDMPNVSTEFIEKMSENFIRSESAAIVPKTENGKLQPLSAIYRVSACMQPLEKLVALGNTYSVHSFLDQIDCSFFDVGKFGFGSISDELFRNVNRPEDLQ